MESVCSKESYEGSRPEESPEGTSTFTERHFVLLWGSQYSWLDYDTIRCKMFCAVCKNHKKNSFVTSGSSNFRRLAFIDLSKSMEHTDAIHAMLKAKQAAPVFATWNKRLTKLC